MTGEKARIVGNVLLFLGMLSFVASCGGCYACVSTLETDYGREEVYTKSGGGVGYGAKSETRAGEGAGYLFLVPFVIGVILIGASGFFSSKADDEGVPKGV
jgi:uncharacterized membrane protein